MLRLIIKFYSKSKKDNILRIDITGRVMIYNYPVLNVPFFVICIDATLTYDDFVPLTRRSCLE